MKYKVGDIVRIVNTDETDFEMGDVVRITEIDFCSNTYPFWCQNEYNGEWVAEKNIEKVNCTWEDFLKCPIGTKVTFEGGETIIKVTDSLGEVFNNNNIYRSYNELQNFKDNYRNCGKIIKIEEPTYITVYELTEKVEEMTIEEVCKALGKQIKIVKDKKNG